MKTQLRNALVSALVLCGALTSAAQAQPSFSVDAQGPSVIAGLNEGDLLVPGIPLPVAVAFPVAGFGFFCPMPAICPTEVDALSMGVDDPLTGLGIGGLVISFSVDEWAVGMFGLPPVSMTTEAAIGEAAADVFSTFLPLTLPVPPGPPGMNVAVFDGDGAPGPVPGLGAIEPSPAGPGLDFGDNVDAIDLEVPPAPPLFFSLDTGFPDLIEVVLGFVPNFGSAVFHGFASGDVLFLAALGGPPAVFAPAALLGLDADGALPDTDDVDALIVWENGNGVYDPTVGPFSWRGGGGTDMVVYSVRRGSAIIGVPDVLLGLPIEEGDVLVPVFDPVDGTPMFDLIEGDFDPGILVAAESLGLFTVRGGGGVGDDLDALDWVSVLDPGFFFGDGFENGDTTVWSVTVP